MDNILSGLILAYQAVSMNNNKYLRSVKNVCTSKLVLLING